jgi:sugar diacid utilization regulator
MSVCLPRRAVLVLGRGDGGGNTAASLPHRGARFGRFVLDSIDTITTHAAEAYLREDNRIRTQTGRAVADLIDGVLAGQPTLQQLPVAPGISPSRPVQIVIARVIDTNDDINTALTSVLEILDANLAIGAAAPLSTIRHQEIVAIVPGSPPISRLHTAARCARERKQILIGIGVSDSPTGFAGAPNAYAEAALTLGYTSPTRPVVALAELRARQLLLLGAGDTTRQLVSEKGRHLQLLPAKERDAAIETILAFSASNMSISAAASALGIHPNTVRYRLARVAQTTGLDPRTFPGLADLHCIIELSRRHSRDATGETTRPPRDQSAAIPKTRAGSVGAGGGSRDKARAAGPG